MRKISIVLILLLAASAFGATSSSLAPSTTNNDDSCDIGVLPAATLLLPYFEVDFKSPQTTAIQTIFTVQNVSAQPQIAHVILWTDWGYPVLSFPIVLTGYDVQPINLYDIFSRAIIAPGPTPGLSGTSINTPIPANPTIGSQPGSNTSNPNFLPSAQTNCAHAPGVFPSVLLTDLQLIFTTGRSTGAALPSCSGPVGGTHDHAIGYITIDVVATCYAGTPASPTYFQSVVLYDNVLTGDYQQLFPGKYALGGPMVHIRAIPEGGAAGSIPGTSLPYTFYDRMLNGTIARTMDRRQPLPSAFAPRFIQGGPGAFNTSFKIWREALTGGDATCDQYAQNSKMNVAEIVRFDEHENATIVATPLIDPPPPGAQLPATSMTPTSAGFFPPPSPLTNDVAGWMFINLNNFGSPAYGVTGARDFKTATSTQTGPRQSQNWILTSMYADPTYAVEGTAAALGNGCSPSALFSTVPGGQIGPAPNVNP